MVTIQARTVGTQARRLRSDVFRFTKKRIRLHSHRSLSPGADEDSVLHHTNIKRLDRLYYSNFDLSKDSASSSPDSSCPSLPGMTIEDLPLWRVFDFAVLPSHQVVLHVYHPYYCDMLNRLFAGPQPWRFGHQHLPKGSNMVGSQEYRNVSTVYPPDFEERPKIGTLMEVLRVMSEPDGRLIILAAGIGRFSTLQTLQTCPHFRANVMLLPDVEEIEFLANKSESSTEQAVAQTIAAAACSATAWWDYELSHRMYHYNLHVVDRIEHPKRASQLEHYLVNAIGANEVMEMPWADKSANSRVRHLLCNGANVLAREERAAIQIAEEAAKAAVHKMMSTLEGMNGAELKRLVAVIHSLLGVEIYKLFTTGVSRELENKDGAISTIGRCALQSGGEKTEKQHYTLLAACLRLENEIWELLDDISAATEKLTNSGRALPHSENGLLCLRPFIRANVGAHSCSSSLEWSGNGAHPQYPALRRLQRLSFAVASVGMKRQDEEGRQRMLECNSIEERLMLGLSALKRCKAEAVALKKLQQPSAADGIQGAEQPGSGNIIMWCIRRVVTFINPKLKSENDDLDSL